MSVVSVDAQRRIYIPKEISLDAKKVIIIPQGTLYVLIPVPEKATEIDVKESARNLRVVAEKKAKGEAKDAAGI